MQSDDEVVEAVANLMVECLPDALEETERGSLLATAKAIITAHDTALKRQVEVLREEIRELRGSATNDYGLLACPECHSVNGPYLYWWHRGQAWVVICADCKHEANAREDAEYKARSIWNDEARAALAATEPKP